MERLYRALINSAHGVRAAARTDASVRQELVALALGLPGGVLIAPSLGWFLAMIGVLLGLLAVELLNTAVEKLADHVTPEQHPHIKAIKDMGSAAVGCLLVLSGLVWMCALLVRFGVA